MCVWFCLAGVITSANDGPPKALGCLSPCVQQPIRIQCPGIPCASSPGWIYCLHLWPMLNPFTCQSAVNMTYSVAVYSRCGHCVRWKAFFYLHLALTHLLNHLVHNRNIKMSKWSNYFRGINDALTIVAKLLQRLKASLLGSGFSPVSLQAVISLLKQPGDSQQATK